MSEWYYVGHYGQLGPLTRDQIDELIEGGVITRETYVWKAGMTNWAQAHSVEELASAFAAAPGFAAPPPPPMPASAGAMGAPPAQATTFGQMGAYVPVGTSASLGLSATLPVLQSDRSRVAAGVMQLLLPGIGRIYLGYIAIGILQILFTLITCGFGIIWTVIDGILILAGTPRLDGYGRLLRT